MSVKKYLRLSYIIIYELQNYTHFLPLLPHTPSLSHWTLWPLYDHAVKGSGQNLTDKVAIKCTTQVRKLLRTRRSTLRTSPRQQVSARSAPGRPVHPVTQSGSEAATLWERTRLGIDSALCVNCLFVCLPCHTLLLLQLLLHHPKQNPGVSRHFDESCQNRKS